MIENATDLETLAAIFDTISGADVNLANLRTKKTPRKKRKITYFIDDSVTAIAYAEDHVMRPSRVRVLHSLVRSLGLDKEMTVRQARPATEEEMRVFHRSAYLECLKQAPRICGDPLEETALSFQKEFDVPAGSATHDCPLFPEVWSLVASQAGASLACADVLLNGTADVAMNWAGGLHHAASANASGFCFVNDIVLCIKRLLHRYSRVLYIDLDVHHGDGVETAFYGNSRVMTFSIHQFGKGFFPGTGDYCTPQSTNSFAVNCPLPISTGDAAYLLSFRTALTAIVSCYDPETIVLQCGADTIAGDLIGRLAVTTFTHTQCVADVLGLGLPTVLLGGGGYHVFHTAKCWAIHTATAIGRSASELPMYVPRKDPYYMEHRRESIPLRPTLHVFLDPDVDRPLSWEVSQKYWRQFCLSIRGQMSAAIAIRQKFTRIVQFAKEDADRRKSSLREREEKERAKRPRTSE